ncbi:hypothetical protein IEI_03071 [Bacillus wiedmannii]|uniref:HGGxSTG domain-containing protein n=1 Tax=Bacillus wiedmannii TaxID=1890302 RepID=UPI000278A3F5|nr:hypothetical protein IEI_03071 [Bacillus wiedmannii]
MKHRKNLRPLRDGLRDYIVDVRDRIRSGELSRESDEMVSIKKKLKADTEICGAITRSGRVCANKIANEKNLRCRMHGGRSTSAKTEEGKRMRDINLENGRKATIHGLYTADFIATLREDEIMWYDTQMKWYQESYEDLDPVDISKIDLALMNTIKSWRKNGKSIDYAVNEKVSMVDFEGRLIRLMDDLGMSRKFRKSRDNASNETKVSWNALFDGMDGK